MRLGAHVSVAGGLELAPERAVDIGCEVIQIFSRNQRQWQASPLSAERCSRFHQAFKNSGLKSACVHASYLINLAAPDREIWKKSIQTMADELRRAEQLQIPFVIVHPGAHKDSGIEKGWKRVARAVEIALDRSKVKNTKLLLENTAGQGTCLAVSLEELQQGLDLIDRDSQLGVCLDTCHLFAAGHEFKSQKNYQRFKKEISRTIGIRKVRVIHLNDSAKPFGGRVDNHAAIGKGKIGSRPFGHWMRDSSWRYTLGILETPGGAKNYARELRLLKRMRKR